MKQTLWLKPRGFSSLFFHGLKAVAIGYPRKPIFLRNLEGHGIDQGWKPFHLRLTPL
jgi:hypothetical protein